MTERKEQMFLRNAALCVCTGFWTGVLPCSIRCSMYLKSSLSSQNSIGPLTGYLRPPWASPKSKCAGIHEYSLEKQNLLFSSLMQRIGVK